VAIAIAAALHAHSLSTASNDPVAALRMIETLWEEFSDLEQTQAGVELMLGFMRAYRALADSENALLWTDRLLPVAERLRDMQAVARGLHGRGVSLIVSGRPSEGLMLLRGSHQLALANDLAEVELGTRVQLTFYEQWGDPAAGLALAREGLEIGQRLGSRPYGFQMVGNAVICALRVGEWDWAAALLEEWLERDDDNNLWIEFHVDRALLDAYRGLDTATDVEIAARRRKGVTDPQYESYEVFARAVAALTSGDLARAVEHAERSATITDYFTPLAIPVAARAALWAGDAVSARRLLELPAMARYWGPVLEADRARIRAGIAALEGRSPESLTGFLDALRAYAQLGLPFEEAAGAVDLAILLPGAVKESAAASALVDAARETLTRLGAKPFLARLEVPRSSGESRVGGAGVSATSGPRDATVAGASTG
jgi:hypothetical protein